MLGYVVVLSITMVTALHHIGHKSKELSLDHLLQQSANAELQLFQHTSKRNYLICGGFFIADGNTSWIALRQDVASMSP